MSLRDVDRVLTVMSWFYEQSEDGNNTLFSLMDKKQPARIDYSSSSEDDEDDDEDDIVYRQVPFICELHYSKFLLFCHLRNIYQFLIAFL